MGKGGYRENAGRKSVWLHPTKRVRLPAHLEETIVDIAQKLDKGELIVFGTESELQDIAKSVLLAIRPRDRIKHRHILGSFLRALKEKAPTSQEPGH